MSTIMGSLAGLAAVQNFQYTPPQAPVPASRWALLGQVFYFVLIFAFVVGLTYLMTRFLATKAHPLRQSQHLEIIDQLVLAPGKSVQLIDCGDRVLIVGCGEKEITLLGEISDPLRLESLRGRDDAMGADAPAFEDYLSTNLTKMPDGRESGIPNALVSAQQNVEMLLRCTQGIFRNGRMFR